MDLKAAGLPGGLKQTTIYFNDKHISAVWQRGGWVRNARKCSKNVQMGDQ
jgi:hypothetical protein